MKVKCIDNRNVEKFLTQGKEYEVENPKLDQSRFIMIDDTLYTHSHNKSRFEVVPSIDEVIKDKEKEKRTMNGLEAVALMHEGKIAQLVDTDLIYCIQNGTVMSKRIPSEKWLKNLQFDFQLDYEEYIEPKMLTGWGRPCYKGSYFYIHSNGVSCGTDIYNSVDRERMDNANYFSTEEKAEEINFKQILFRKLQRFSDENGGNEIDWSDTDQLKYGIFYNSDSNRLLSDDRWVSRDFGQVYFISEEVAEKAIELFHDDLIKYFTGDFGGDK